MAGDRPQSANGPGAPATPLPERLAESLEPILAGMIAAHERLLDAVDHHRAALASADAGAIGRAIDEQGEAISAIAQLEQRRAALLGSSRGDAGRPLTIREAARTLDDPPRTRLLEMAERLRGLIGTVRERQAVAREATRTLMEHTRGLMAQVGAALSHAGTYGRAGKVQSTTPACAVLDMST